MILNLRTIQPRKADKERALMLRLRFKLLLYTALPSDRLQGELKRLQNTIEAHVNFYGPSAWLEKRFVNRSGEYAGLYWAFNGTHGNYRLAVFNKNPVVMSTLGVRA